MILEKIANYIAYTKRLVKRLPEFPHGSFAIFHKITDYTPTRIECKKAYIKLSRY
jgi:hypothetical protein